MTPEQLNLAIAKKRGWKVHPKNKWCVIPPKSPHSVQRLSTLPNFVGDLNLMHELELKLNQKEDAEYRHKYLPEVVGGCLAICITATALQRAEAYAKLKGVWKE